MTLTFTKHVWHKASGERERERESTGTNRSHILLNCFFEFEQFPWSWDMTGIPQFLGFPGYLRLRLRLRDAIPSRYQMEPREIPEQWNPGKFPGPPGISRLHVWSRVVCGWRDTCAGKRTGSRDPGASLRNPNKNKGYRSDCNNYRGISLLIIVGKVFARVLLSRLQKLAESIPRVAVRFPVWAIHDRHDLFPSPAAGEVQRTKKTTICRIHWPK